MKYSERSFYLKRTGDLSSLFGIREITLNEGRAKDIRGYLVKNGKGVSLMVLRDRGMDIPVLEYKGYNIGALTKAGISSPFAYTYTKDLTDGFLRQFFGGFLTTCGMLYAGAPSSLSDQEKPLHGRLSNSIAEQVGVCEEIENDEVVLVIKGKLREARIFAENMVLQREIRIYTESNQIKLIDEVENLGFVKQPVMLIYHANFGYPMLDEGARVYFSTKNVEALTENARDNIKKYHIMEKPEDVKEEEVYYHTGESGNDFAMLHNEKIGLAVLVEYEAAQFPILCEWKSMQSGDYALGLEPTTSGTKGFAGANKEGLVSYLEGQQKKKYEISFSFLENAEEINKWKDRTKEKKI